DGSRATLRNSAGERRLQTRACETLGAATPFTTSPLLMNEADRARYARIERDVRSPRYGGDCYAYAMLASGFVDLVIEPDLKPYDIVALIPSVEGAGGVITDWDGNSAKHGGRIVAAGDARVHEAALKRLAHSA